MISVFGSGSPCSDDLGVVSGGQERPLHLIRSSEQQSTDLLKVEFIKVKPSPVFCLYVNGELGGCY